MAVASINTTPLSRSLLPVCITKVESPTLFWVQLRYNGTALQVIEEELTWFMERKARGYILYPRAINTNCVVAIRNGDNWSREQIISFDNTTVITHLDDWGHVVHKDMFHLYLLSEPFCQLFWQAIPCGIFGIAPIGRVPIWPVAAREITKILTEKREGCIRIRKTIASKSADVDLKICKPGRVGPTTLKFEQVILGQAKLELIQPCDYIHLTKSSSTDQ